ncbi:Ribonuclease T2-like [Parasponia andersonii]|uniref:Ribonuclease T2-like n=1 Tax=Parasponia andersonii TaxID=3476 RepID=A0A2P5ASK5_PARAD|nr:Ribonuclease T2-like [Parasponia andersonii]
MEVNFLSAFKRAGIEPNGKSYSSSAMKNSVRNAIGLTPKIKSKAVKMARPAHDGYFEVTGRVGLARLNERAGLYDWEGAPARPYGLGRLPGPSK